MQERKRQWNYQIEKLKKTPEQKLIEKLNEVLACKNAEQLNLKLSMDALILVNSPAYAILVEARSEASSGNFEQAMQKVQELIHFINQ